MQVFIATGTFDNHEGVYQYLFTDPDKAVEFVEMVSGYKHSASPTMWEVITFDVKDNDPNTALAFHRSFIED